METFLHLIAFGIGIGGCVIGLAALLFPEKASGGFGIKVKGVDAAYVRVTGARDVFIGAVFLYFYLRWDAEILSCLCFLTAFVSSADFWVTRVYGSRFFSYCHLGATVAVIAYGLALHWH